MKQPVWNFLKDVNVLNVKNNKHYKLITPQNFHPTDEQFASIVEACSGPEIYKWLFSEIFPNGYSLENAVGFIKRAKQGWLDNSHFVFLLLSEENMIVGALDIKSNDLKAGEIGYWVHRDHSGLATNAISAIKDFAKLAGYEVLYAQTKKGNDKSDSALLRNHFELNDAYKESSACEKAFYIKLN